MKVILVQDVDKLGEIGDVVDVADGYGSNYLIPRGYALAATARNKRQLEHEHHLREHRIAQARKDAEAFAGTLQAVPCHFTRKAGEEGKLFGSITPQDIADAPGFRGGTWNGDGTILFGSEKGVYRVSAEGSGNEGTPSEPELLLVI